nr:MAG TPA: hypothetical protein [Caudoviricetes sp.]
MTSPFVAVEPLSLIISDIRLKVKMQLKLLVLQPCTLRLVLLL